MVSPRIPAELRSAPHRRGFSSTVFLSSVATASLPLQEKEGRSRGLVGRVNGGSLSGVALLARKEGRSSRAGSSRMMAAAAATRGWWAAARDFLRRPFFPPEARRLCSSDTSAGLPKVRRVREPPRPKEVDRWTEKRALFGMYDNIGILGDFMVHPKELIKGPVWLRGWKGNELQRCIRKKKMVGNRMFLEDYHNLNKRIRYLYSRFNRYGKHRH